MRSQLRQFGAIGLVFLLSSCQSKNQSESKAQSLNPPAEEDFAFDPLIAEKIAKLFQGLVDSRHPPGTTGVKRAVFLKPHACAKAEFTVLDSLPNELQKGIFATAKTYDAWVRMSSDTDPRVPDQNNSTIGLAIKVLDVPGKKVLPGEEDAETHDFLLQNHHIFFVDTAQDFLEFTEAIFSGQFQKYLQDHPITKKILDDMDKPVANVLHSQYWSTTPYRFGKKNYVKYSAVPCEVPPTTEPIPANEPNYLRTRVVRDLAAADACFELKVQVRSGEHMPLDAATVEWSETEAPFQTVARVKIAKQDIVQHDQTCENFSFTAWHALPTHKPVGSVNEARGIVYKQLADKRRSRNGVPTTEPTVTPVHPKPPHKPR